MTEFWDQMGTDDGDLPVHLPFSVNKEGKGPVSDQEAAHYVCWCPNEDCPLTKALALAHEAGARSEFERILDNALQIAEKNDLPAITIPATVALTVNDTYDGIDHKYDNHPILSKKEGEG